MNSEITPERKEYLNRRKRGESAKPIPPDSETTDSLNDQKGEEDDRVNEDDEDNDGNDENESPLTDEAKPCGPMRIQRKRKLTELSDCRANMDHKRHKTSGGGTCEWVGYLSICGNHDILCFQPS